MKNRARPEAAAFAHAIRPVSSSLFNRLLLLPAMAALAAVGAQAASNLAWDPSHTPAGTTTTPTGSGGAGIWTTGTGADWSTSTSDTTWANANGDNAFFNGTGATVTLGSDITVNNLNISVTGYTIAKDTGNTFTLTVNGTITTPQTGTITAKLGGSNGLTKAGAGTLVLNGTGAYTGNTSIQAGVLQARLAGALPASTTVVIGSGANTATLDVRASQTVAGITIGGTGTLTITQTQTTGTTTLTINPSGAGLAAADSTFSGTVKDGDATHLLALTKAGSNTLTLTGTNSYSGATNVTGGTLQLGSNLANTVSVTVSGTGTTLSSNVANVNLGVGAVSMGTGTLSAGGTGTAGSFTLAANQNFSATTGTLNFDLLGSASFDQIIGSGSGTFNLSGTTLALSGLTSVSGTYQLFTGFGGTNTVSGITITGLGIGVTGSLDTTGLLTVIAVPEPSTYAAILGAIALGFVAYRRRR